MNKYLDYQSYRDENKNIINLLQDNNFLTYTRIKDIIFVLDKVSDKLMNEKKIDDEIEVIFESGYEFFYYELEQIKSFFKSLNNDFILFKKYDQIIFYNLYILELINALEDEELLTDEREDKLNNLNKEINQLIASKNEVSNEFLDKLEIELSIVMPKNKQIDLTSSIFERIAVEVTLWDR